MEISKLQKIKVLGGCHISTKRHPDYPSLPIHQSKHPIVYPTYYPLYPLYKIMRGSSLKELRVEKKIHIHKLPFFTLNYLHFP